MVSWSAVATPASVCRSIRHQSACVSSPGLAHTATVCCDGRRVGRKERGGGGGWDVRARDVRERGEGGMSEQEMSEKEGRVGFHRKMRGWDVRGRDVRERGEGGMS